MWRPFTAAWMRVLFLAVEGTGSRGCVGGSVSGGRPGRVRCVASPRPGAATCAGVRGRSGRQAPRSAVPWTRVGPGWALAEDLAATARPARSPQGSIILYLVDSRGGRYRLFAWPARDAAPYGELVDWSGDTRRVLCRRCEPLNIHADLGPPHGQAVSGWASKVTRSRCV